MLLRRRQRKRQKSHITRFGHFFAVTAGLRRELPNFKFYRQREHTTTKVSFSFTT